VDDGLLEVAGQPWVHARGPRPAARAAPTRPDNLSDRTPRSGAAQAVTLVTELPRRSAGTRAASTSESTTLCDQCRVGAQPGRRLLPRRRARHGRLGGWSALLVTGLRRQALGGVRLPHRGYDGAACNAPSCERPAPPESGRHRLGGWPTLAPSRQVLRPGRRASSPTRPARPPRRGWSRSRQSLPTATP
jgi:hypothetical protein